MRLLYLLFLLLAALGGFSLFRLTQTVRFFPYEIPASLPFHPEWEVSCVDRDLCAVICAQPFTYLGRGHQCFVLESQDKQYVLKLPFHSKTLPPPWLRPLPFFAEKYRAFKMQQKERKRNKDASSYVLAFHSLREETGLLYLHLNRTSSLQRTLKVTDPSGTPHTIDLDKTEFLLQKKAEQLYPTITRWMQQGRSEEAKEGLSCLITLFKKQYAQGIEDKENVLNTNYGFYEGQPMQIDVGRLRKRQAPWAQEEHQAKLIGLFEPLQAHLEEHYPELADHLKSLLGTHGSRR